MLPFVLFSVSGITLVVFIAFLMYEHIHTIGWYERIRLRGDTLTLVYVHKLVFWVEKMEDGLSFKSTLFTGVQFLAKRVASVARSVEHGAHYIGRSANKHVDASAVVKTKSTFLKEISTHKKNLDINKIKLENSILSGTEDVTRSE